MRVAVQARVVEVELEHEVEAAVVIDVLQASKGAVGAVSVAVAVAVVVTVVIAIMVAIIVAIDRLGVAQAHGIGIDGPRIEAGPAEDGGGDEVLAVAAGGAAGELHEHVHQDRRLDMQEPFTRTLAGHGEGISRMDLDHAELQVALLIELVGRGLEVVEQVRVEGIVVDDVQHGLREEASSRRPDRPGAGGPSACRRAWCCRWSAR